MMDDIICFVATLGIVVYIAYKLGFFDKVKDKNDCMMRILIAVVILILLILAAISNRNHRPRVNTLYDNREELADIYCKRKGVELQNLKPEYNMGTHSGNLYDAVTVNQNVLRELDKRIEEIEKKLDKERDRIEIVREAIGKEDD